MHYKRNNHIRWLRRENTNNLSYMCLLIEETAQREKKNCFTSFFLRYNDVRLSDQFA